jgi:glutaredoxin
MKFTVYSKEGCPYCDKIKNILNMLNLESKTYTLYVDFDRDQFYSQFGHGSTFPQVILNDEEKLGGCMDTINYLREENIL